MRPQNILTVELHTNTENSYSFTSPQSPHTPHSPPPAGTFTFASSPNGKQVKIVGDYMLGKKLGRGSFCKVVAATHIQTGCKYAMKVMKPNIKKGSLVDIEREIQVLSGIKHPNIIGLHDILYIDATDNLVVGNPTTSLVNAKKIFLVVDLAGNGELFDYIVQKKKLSEDEARWVFRQILSAVEYLHAHCIAHRDLKPENILLDSSNTIKLNDFGLSNFVQPEKKMNTFCGSPVYAAPEVMRKSYYDGVIADVWSLGVILFTMVTGCLPWRLNTQTNRIENIEDMLNGRFDIPSCLSTECATLLCKMLVPHPAQRARLNEVRKHPWVNKGYLDYPPRFLEPTVPVTEIDKVVLKQMESMGFMQARVAQDVFGNKSKPSVTVYHTLLKRRNLKLLLHSTPAVATEAKPSPRTSPRTSPRLTPNTQQRQNWKPMDTVYEEHTHVPPPPSLSNTKSFTTWVKELTHTNVKNMSDVDLTVGRIAIPSAHGLSNFLKRRHSVPETQHELRTMNTNNNNNNSNNSNNTNTNTNSNTNTNTTTTHTHHSPKKHQQGLIERLFSRRKSKTIVGVALPAA